MKKKIVEKFKPIDKHHGSLVPGGRGDGIYHSAPFLKKSGG